MSGLIRRLENIYAAAAFGECGEWKTAKVLVKGGSPVKAKVEKRVERPRLRLWAIKS